MGEFIIVNVQLRGRVPVPTDFECGRIVNEWLVGFVDPVNKTQCDVILKISKSKSLRRKINPTTSSPSDVIFMD